MARFAPWWVVGLSALTAAFALSHSFEDFAHGTYADFGLALLPAAIIVAVAFAFQVLAAAGALTDSRLALAANAGLALVWLVGSMADHLPDVLAEETWRTGLSSEVLALGVMISSALWLVASIAAFWLGRQRPRI